MADKKNVVFLSPNFPENYWHFCHELKNNGMRVLGIGDCPYDNLKWELKESLDEYYKVDNLADYESVYRAVAFFIFKYGKIDWLESNNEYWLERDAHLRTEFNITSGFQDKDIPAIKYKSKMKAYYKRAGIPAARWHIVDDEEGCKTFIGKVGYPVIVKPDNGVGASHTYRISNDDELAAFLAEKEEDVEYIMEEFVHATVNSYDAIIDSTGTPIFETGNISIMSIMDIVNDNDNSVFYIVKELANDIREAGRATVNSFGVKSRFVHFEFFRLDEDQPSLGKKGDVVGLEVNMRPSGGISPDMMNFANSTNVYKIWADMIALDKTTMNTRDHYHCVFVGRRDGRTFKLNDEEYSAKYAAEMRMQGRVADALSGAMGNRMFIANLPDNEALMQYLKDGVAPAD